MYRRSQEYSPPSFCFRDFQKLPVFASARAGTKSGRMKILPQSFHRLVFAMFCDTFCDPSASLHFILPPSFRDQPFQYFPRSTLPALPVSILHCCFWRQILPQTFRRPSAGSNRDIFCNKAIGPQISERSETCCKN